MKFWILVLLMIGFVSAVNVDFDCPDEIFVDGEFECSLEVSGGDGEYDVKVDIDGERDSVLRIWDSDEDKWKSGYYYLNDIVDGDDEVNVRLKVLEDGDYEGFLKLRQGDKREFFEIYIDVLKKDDEGKGGDKEIYESGKIEEEEIVLQKKDVVISLNDVVVVEEEMELVYVSKNAKIADYLIYAFALFLIFVIGILVWSQTT